MDNYTQSEQALAEKMRRDEEVGRQVDSFQAAGTELRGEVYNNKDNLRAAASIVRKKMDELRAVGGNWAVYHALTSMMDTYDETTAVVGMRHFMPLLAENPSEAYAARAVLKEVHWQCRSETMQPYQYMQKNLAGLIATIQDPLDKIAFAESLFADRAKHGFQNFQDEAPPLTKLAIDEIVKAAEQYDDSRTDNISDTKARIYARCLIQTTPDSAQESTLREKILDGIAKEKSILAVADTVMACQRYGFISHENYRADEMIDRAAADKWASFAKDQDPDVTLRFASILIQDAYRKPVLSSCKMLDAARASFIEAIKKHPQPEQYRETLQVLAASRKLESAEAKEVLKTCTPSPRPSFTRAALTTVVTKTKQTLGLKQ